MSEHISWLIELEILSGKLDDFRAVVAELVASTQGEPGVLGYEWAISPDAKTCHVREHYADSAAIVSHSQSFGKFADRFFKTCRPVRFSVYGQPHAEAQAAIADLQPVYFARLGGFIR